MCTLSLETQKKKHEKSVPIPHREDALCQVRIKLAQWFWRKRFLNIFNIILLFCFNLPLEKGVALHLNKLESKDALSHVW